MRKIGTNQKGKFQVVISPEMSSQRAISTPMKFPSCINALGEIVERFKAFL